MSALLGFCTLNWAFLCLAVAYGWSRADALGPAARYWLHGGAALCLMLLLGLVYLFLTVRRPPAPRALALDRDTLEEEHDPLTGFINRRGFNLHLEMAVAHARRHQQAVTLLYLGLDGIRQVVDRCDHSTGDRLLRVLAERWQDAVRDDEALARLSGEGFALLAYGTGAAVEPLAQRLIELTAGPLLDDLPAGLLRASIGMAAYPDHGDDRHALLRAAEGALQAARVEGPGHFRWAE
jgi:diguanylate cyclase (GGDEF)-like protein